MPITIANKNTNYAKNLVAGYYPKKYGYGHRRLYVQECIGGLDNLVEDKIIPIGRLPISSVLTSFAMRYVLTSGQNEEALEVTLKQANLGGDATIKYNICVIPGAFAVQNGDVRDLFDNNKLLEICPMVPNKYNDYYNLAGVKQVQNTPYTVIKGNLMVYTNNTANQHLSGIALSPCPVAPVYGTLDLGHATFYLRTKSYDNNVASAADLRDRPLYESRGELAENSSLRQKLSSGDAIICLMVTSSINNTMTRIAPDNSDRISMVVEYSYSEPDTSLCYADHYFALPFPM